MPGFHGNLTGSAGQLHVSGKCERCMLGAVKPLLVGLAVCFGVNLVYVSVHACCLPAPRVSRHLQQTYRIETWTGLYPLWGRAASRQRPASPDPEATGNFCPTFGSKGIPFLFACGRMQHCYRPTDCFVDMHDMRVHATCGLLLPDGPSTASRSFLFEFQVVNNLEHYAAMW